MEYTDFVAVTRESSALLLRFVSLSLSLSLSCLAVLAPAPAPGAPRVLAEEASMFLLNCAYWSRQCSYTVR